jgi:hypothetical protein
MPLRSYPLAKPDCQLFPKGGIARRKVARTMIAFPALALACAHPSGNASTFFKHLDLHTCFD